MSSFSTAPGDSDFNRRRAQGVVTAGFEENVNSMFAAAFAITLPFIAFAHYKIVLIALVLLLSGALSMASVYFYIYMLAAISCLYQKLRILKKELSTWGINAKPHLPHHTDGALCCCEQKFFCCKAACRGLLDRL